MKLHRIIFGNLTKLAEIPASRCWHSDFIQIGQKHGKQVETSRMTSWRIDENVIYRICMCMCVCCVAWVIPQIRSHCQT